MNPDVKTILLVDDEALIALAEAHDLEEFDYNVITVYSPDSAIDMVRQRSDIDLVLMDINLGANIDGIETARRINQHREMPVIFLSSNTEPHIVKKLHSFCPYGFVHKGSDTSVLDISIRMALKLFASHRKNKENEWLLHAVTSSIPDTCQLIVNNDLSIGFITGQSCLALKNVIPGTSLKHIFPLQYNKLLPLYKKAFNGEKTECELEINSMLFRQRVVPLPGNDEGKIFRILVVFDKSQHLQGTSEHCQKQLFNLQQAQRLAHFGLWEWNIRTEEIIWSPEMYDFYDVSPNNFVPSISSLSNFIHPHDAEYVAQNLEQIISGRQSVTFDFRIITGEGSTRYISTTGDIVSYDGQGRPQIMLGVNFDVTEQKLQENATKSLLDEKELAIREIHHRVKNNLIFIRSLLSLQLPDIHDPDAKNMVESIRNRIRSIILFYEKFHQQQNIQQINMRKYLTALIDELRHIAPWNIFFKLEIDDTPINSRVAFPLGNIINELVTNAIKHAFTDTMDQRIISLDVKREINHFIITVKDNGKGFDLENITTGFGLKLIDILTDQLRGKKSFTFNEGTECIVKFEISSEFK